MEQIILNGKAFTRKNLGEIEHLGSGNLSPETLSGIRQFLEEWWSSESFIEVKTSGSTGTPKTIRLAKNTVSASAEKTIEFFGLNSETTGLLCLPCRYIAGKLMLVRAIRAGMHVRVEEPATDVLKRLTHEIHFAAMIPSQVESALGDRETSRIFNAIDQVLIGGGPVDAELEVHLEGCTNSIFHSYGMTETATHVALRNISKEESLYKALPGVSFSLDERKCLVIEADHLEGKLVSNDMVELHDEFRFKWLGRADRAIISGGLKFIPELLEKKISPYLSIPFYITGVPDPKLGSRIVLVIEGETWPEERVELLNREIQVILSEYERPKDILFLKRFSRTDTGKIRRTGIS